MLLEVKDLVVAYDKVRVIWGISLEIDEKEKVAIIGPNGAGKTTLLKTICGLKRPVHGSIIFRGERIDGLPAHTVVKKGLVLVPEGGRIFPRMSVLENLKLGACTSEARAEEENTLKLVYKFFPILKERENQMAGTLSGGEQRMLSIARGLMSLPKLIIIDELSLGLMPTLVSKLFGLLEELPNQGITVLVVEQYVKKALEFADRGYLIERGKIVLEGSGKELLQNELVKKTYL